MPTDLVTGASGFIGSHLTDTLLSAGRGVRILLRPTSSLKWLPEEAIEVVRTGSWSPEAIRPVVEAVDTVYHVAGTTHARNKREFFEFHVDGTRSLLEACSEATHPPRRVVIFSSLAAAGPSRTGRLLTEEDEPQPVSWYGESKLEQERIAHSYAEALSLVIIRPPAVYGPRDRDLFHVFKMAKKGYYFALAGGSGMQSMTYVDDIVRGAILAGSNDVVSGRVYYIASHEITTWAGLASILSLLLGVGQRRIPVPASMLPLVGFLAQHLSRFRGVRVPLDRNKAMEGRYPHWICSPARAREELCFRAVMGLPSGVEKTLAWYREQGWL